MRNNKPIMQKKIFIFRGSPASGKGTVTKEFIKELPGKITFLELDNFRWGFHLKNRNVSDISHEEHELAYVNFLAILENYLRNGNYTIVVEGLFSWSTPGPHGNMQDLLKLCTKHNYQSIPILLYADKKILWRRNQKRDYVVPKDEFDELYNYVMYEISDDELRIDVGANDISDTIEILKKYI